MTEASTLLQMSAVEKRYGAKTVLTVEAFQLNYGDRILLDGANGSGKSTFLRILAGVSAVSRGHVKRSARLREMALGYVPQSGGLYSDMTLRQNLAIYARLYGTQPARPPEESWFIRDTSLSAHVDTLVGEMSGGYRQFAAFACVISAGPHALLLDEPSSELDGDHVTQLYSCLDLVREAMAFIVVSTHDTRALPFVNRKVAIVQGRVSQ